MRPGPTGVAARPLVRSGSGIHQLERFQRGAVVVEAREDARAAKCEFRIGVRLFEREAPRLDTLLHDGIEVLEHRLRIVGEVLEVTEVVVGQNHEGSFGRWGGAVRDAIVLNEHCSGHGAPAHARSSPLHSPFGLFRFIEASFAFVDSPF